MPSKFHHALFGLFASLLLGGTAQAQFQPLDRVAAIVDEDVVMQSQVDQRLEDIYRQLRASDSPMPPAEEIREQVLDRLILESIQLQMGARAGIRIDDASLNQTMQQIAERNGLSLEQFRQALAADGISFEQAREQIRREMIINQVRQRRVGDRIQITDQEVRNFLASELGRNQTAADFRLAMIVVPLADSASDSEVQQAATHIEAIHSELLSGADMANVARQRMQRGEDVEAGELGWRKSSQLPGLFAGAIERLQVGEFTRPLRSPSGLHIIQLLEKRGGDGQLMDEFRVRHILIKPSEIRSENDAQQLVERLYQRIADGESFATLARSFSEDPGSALNGGTLEWISPDALVPEFREIMTSIPQGQVSRPFATQFGWHILEVLDQRRVDMTSEMREQQAINLLRNRKFDDELQSWLLEIRQDAFVEIKSQ
ncbi:MAG: peptidylprolyl isomerase [Halopseudomonas yangmingensis]